MQKIRINELARELEIKANLILELLPTLGVTDKKTHSSSLDDDIAEKIRRHFQRNGGAPAPAAASVAPAHSEGASPVSNLEHSSVTGVEEAARPHMAAAQPAHPLKPPLRAAGLPFVPPLAKPAPVAGSAAAGPAILEPSGTPPHAPAEIAAGVLHPAVPSVKPIPTAPLPGHTATGPRAPLPAGLPPTAPLSHASASAGPFAAGAPHAPAMPGARPPLAPGQQPAPTRPLAGQPPLRPVVPPRPDLAPKLRQAGPATGASAAAGALPAGRRPLQPTPGQPIFQRPVRPGQPVRPGMPGAPRPGMPARAGAPAFGSGMRAPARPMHPTSRTPRAGVAPGAAPAGVPPGPDRRQHRPGGAAARARTARDREIDQESKILHRRSEPRSQVPEPPPPITREIIITEGITVKELSEKLGIKASMMIKKLVDKGIFATINQTLDSKMSTDLAAQFGASTSTITYEEEAMQDVQQAEDAQDLQPRAPVVTIMGHVDHGKTSLLDAIRQTDVAAHEAGGITQAIGAYQVEHKGRKIVFIDTPGHEAFTRMRARGSKITDLVILVVAADDGVMPQTLEAIDHARAAKVPILVAINKIDKPDAQPERVKQQLADRGLLAEDWGGETVMVPVSAKAQTNLDLLLEMILLIADLQDLKANPNRPAMGTVIEAKRDRGQGDVATVLVQNGTLRVGEYFIVGAVFGKVRAMLDDRGNQVKEAPPSTPVVVLGLGDLPDPGDSLQVVTDTEKAKQIVTYRESKVREQAMAKSARMTLETLHEQMRTGDVKELAIILKADVTGSVEVLSDTLERLSTDKVKINILHSGVGAISESDVLLAASAANAIIIGFNVRPERTAAVIAEKEKVDIRLHTVIYDLTDEIKRAMTGLLEPVFKETFLGRAEVRETFRIPKVGAVAGCMVLDGKLTRDSEARLLRDNVVVYTGKVGSLRRFKDDVSEVKNGFECGV
ncbi:MAG TPA: translation initiation factor IF-2, partial [Bryobacterales bacterium]|nr:translation initiation factor IF-2 [Bryobacterales bacterium]